VTELRKRRGQVRSRQEEEVQGYLVPWLYLVVLNHLSFRRISGRGGGACLVVGHPCQALHEKKGKFGSRGVS